MKRKYLFLTILALAIAFVVIACANPVEDVQGNEVAASPSGNKTTVAKTTPSVTTPLLTTPGTTPNIVPVTAPATTPNTTAGTALVTTPITTPVTTFDFGISLSIADPSLLSDPSIVHFIDDRSPSNDQHILVVANKPIKYFCFNEIMI